MSGQEKPLETNFNDDELANIMSEIETLEQEFLQENPENKEEALLKIKNEKLSPDEDIVSSKDLDELSAMEADEVENEELSKSNKNANLEKTASAEDQLQDTEAIDESLDEKDENLSDEPHGQNNLEVEMAQSSESQVEVSEPENESDDFEDVSDEEFESITNEAQDFQLNKGMNTSNTKKEITPIANKEVKDDSIMLNHEFEVKKTKITSPSEIEDSQESIHHENQSKIIPLHQGTAMNQLNSKQANTHLSFSVSGQMTLDMAFTVGGQKVDVSVSENGLEITLESGAKFVIPIESNERLLKAS